MPGTTVNNGNQQVSIYPYQQLSSVLGNEVSYGILNPGVYSSAVVITDGGANIVFTIKAGTTLVFQRSAIDPLVSTITDTIIGKVVLGSDYAYTVAKSTLWTSTYSGTVYIIADWTYSLSSPSLLYANFSLSKDSSIQGDIRNNDGTSSHVLIVATILNNNYYVTNFPNGSPSNTSDMTKYHLSSESQPNRDVLRREYIKNNQFRIDFDPSGRGVYINSGHSFVGNNAVFTNPQFGNTGNTYTYTDTTLPFNLQGSGAGTFGTGHWYPLKNGSGVVLPPTGLINFYPITSQIINGVTYGIQTNVPINITGSESSYYQIDFLRIKMDEVLHTQVVGWESFLQPAGSFDFVGFSTLYTSASGLNTPNKMSYLSQYVFPLSGDGEILLVAIRPRGGAYGSYTPGVPVADGASNTLWPESCVFPREASIPQVGSASTHKRFKIPVWNSTDLGVN